MGRNKHPNFSNLNLLEPLIAFVGKYGSFLLVSPEDVQTWFSLLSMIVYLGEAGLVWGHPLLVNQPRVEVKGNLEIQICISKLHEIFWMSHAIILIDAPPLSRRKGNFSGPNQWFVNSPTIIGISGHETWVDAWVETWAGT